VGFVTAAGHERSDVTDDLAASFPRPPGRAPEVALLHTQVVGARDTEAHDRYAPSELGALRASGFDYWALGHVHVRQALSDRPAIHYSGNTQGRDPRESGPREASSWRSIPAAGPDRRADVGFVELADVRWETLVVDELREVRRLRDLADVLQARWSRAREEDPGLENGRWMLRVRLAGPCPLRDSLARPEAEEELLEALGQPLALLDLALDTRGVRALEAVRDHVERPDVLGEILRMVSELADPAGPSPADSLGIVAADLAGAAGVGGESLDRYLRDLLNGADSALLDAVLDRTDE
jgi:DNA repair protein SbcD/Mre11